jgi:hypothetical protein
MQQKADIYGVDLLLIDTGKTTRSAKESFHNKIWPPGDLHDGNGLSDATSPDGVLSNPIFNNIEYDVLTIGKP